jgi:hypothetical protein
MGPMLSAADGSEDARWAARRTIGVAAQRETRLRVIRVADRRRRPRSRFGGTGDGLRTRPRRGLCDGSGGDGGERGSHQEQFVAGVGGRCKERGSDVRVVETAGRRRGEKRRVDPHAERTESRSGRA